MRRKKLRCGSSSRGSTRVKLGDVKKTPVVWNVVIALKVSKRNHESRIKNHSGEKNWRKVPGFGSRRNDYSPSESEGGQGKRASGRNRGEHLPDLAGLEERKRGKFGVPERSRGKGREEVA